MMNEMNRLFNAKKKAVAKTNEIGCKLDALINERWGFHYSDVDLDPAIDTLDYGIDAISFKSFCLLMDEINQDI